MTLPKFIIGMTFAIFCVSIWSYLDSASAGTLLLRAVVCAILLQVGYFAIVLAMVFVGKPKVAVAPKQVGQSDLNSAPAPNATDV
jgi:exopolysaccharide production repressor protein